MIREQIEDREQRRLLEAEKKDQETQSMLRYLERLQQEDMDNLVKKREAQASLMEDVALCNEVRNTDTPDSEFSTNREGDSLEKPFEIYVLYLHCNYSTPTHTHACTPLKC